MPILAQQLLLQLILILLNAFFAATEIAVISLNDKRIKARADDGDKKAVKMLRMIEEPTRFLSTIQIGITLAGFLGSAFAADNFAERLSVFLVKTFDISTAQIAAVNTVAVIVITLIISFFTLVLGELVPKRVAMRYKEKLAEAVCEIISVLAVILNPFIWLLTVSTNGVLRLFGIDPYETEEPVSEEDIVLMLDAGADYGSLDQNDIEYIKNVFKLDRMDAKDVMTPRKSVVFISVDSTEEEILNVIEQEGYSRIPVINMDEDDIVGILHTKDFLLKHSRPNFKLQDVMFRPTFIPETAHLDTLFTNMQKEHKHIVVIVNEYGETAGIVTMEDILEELVGEIWDEHDEAVEKFIKLDDGAYHVLCSASIDDFFAFFSLASVVKTEATTVNGWITDIIGYIPKPGFKFAYENLMITVTKATNLMVNEITVQVDKHVVTSEDSPLKP